MPIINGRACVANGRNLYLNSKTIDDSYARNRIPTKVTVEPFDSTTNMWHIVAAQGTGTPNGIYLANYAIGKIPDNSDWSYSVDIKGTGKVAILGIEYGNKNPVVGTIGSEWSRISQSGHIGIGNKTIVMYFDDTSSPVDVYIKLPKLEIGTTSTPLIPAPVDKVFSDGKQVYGRNLYLNSKTIKDSYSRNSLAVKITVEPFDSATNMWHIVAAQGTGIMLGIYLPDYANGKIPDNSDWSYSVDVKGIGKIKELGVEDSNKNPVIGTVGSEWSRISQAGRVGNPEHKTIVMYFDNNSSPIDVYIKLPKLEIGTPTPWTPAPEDVM